MRWTWWPWLFVVRRFARLHGFLDPIVVLSRLHGLAQPSEVLAPTELLRMAAILHARGLMNSQVIQHNLDWVWPFWIERQYDPRDPAFVPRAFSLTHINLTHRNWTAIGLPNVPLLPLVDPRGLVTPLFDGWSLDGWLFTTDGRRLLPSRTPQATQRLLMNGTLAVETQCTQDDLQLTSRAEVVGSAQRPMCRIVLTGTAATPGWLVATLRPYNPEGVSFIHHVEPRHHRRGWVVEGRALVSFDQTPERLLASHYLDGDVFRHLPRDPAPDHARSAAGLATAAALFPFTPGQLRQVTLTVPLVAPRRWRRHPRPAAAATWPESLRGSCQAQLPTPHLQFLYDAAVRSLILHTPDDAFPGPFTYKRFWFRDAAFILQALLCCSLSARVARVLARYPARQTATGYFRSQDGEWDANGEALWILGQFSRLTGQVLPPAWRTMVRRGADWILRKRTSPALPSPHAGLLPAGFSAEHFGPNDYYYWDDFWAVAGLRAAMTLLEAWGDARAAVYRRAAEDLQACIERSLRHVAERIGVGAIPASPYRRLDAGAIGSLVGSYPLQVLRPEDPRLLATARYLIDNELLDGTFFQEISHSGMNPYLTLHLAQVLLRAGDARAETLMQRVAALASPTGQWPEAVHPRTRGGCMGDGQHVWASAEWVLMVRHCFVREEGAALILGSGLWPSWRQARQPLAFGPTLTSFGPVSVQLAPADSGWRLSWQGPWRGPAPHIEVRAPGTPVQHPGAGESSVLLTS